MPDRVAVPRRKVKYIQSDNLDDFKKMFPKIGTFGARDVSKSGGMISENTIIKLLDGISMFGVSYKGDLEGWERKIEEFCHNFNLIYGEINGDSLFLSNGDKFLLSEFYVEFY